MFLSKPSTRKLLKLVILSLLVTAVIVFPSLLGNEFNFFDLPFLGDSAYAQGSGAEGSQEGKIDITKMVMGSLAGLVLFLYGVTRMAEGLREVAGDHAKKILSKFTTNPFAGVLTGTAATTIFDSSSVTIIMVIAMVSAGLLTFVQSLGVVMGSNIGTTIGAQIIAFEINEYAPIALLIGAGLHFFCKTERQKNIGLIVFGVGLLFFGLDVIGDAMKPLEKNEAFINWMRTLGEKPLLGAGVGALFTMLIQSSVSILEYLNWGEPRSQFHQLPPEPASA